MNRGIAHRRIFESESDIRYFLSLLAREVRAGHIEIHAYCILSNHFHLLLLSKTGQLPAVMQRVESQYVRWFNRRHDRDGALFRGRFGSKPIENDRYHFTLFRYFDWNPLDAGIALKASDYRYCTAHHWETGSFPNWLSTWFVQNELDRYQGTLSYSELFAPDLSEELAAWIQRRSESGRDATDPLNILFGGAPEPVREWFASRAQIADESKPGSPHIAAKSVEHALDANTDLVSQVEIQSCRADALSVMRCALLRELCASQLREVAARTGLSIPTCSRRIKTHALEMRTNLEYGDVIAKIALDAVRSFFAGGR